MSEKSKSRFTIVTDERTPTESRSDQAPMVLRRERRIKELEAKLELSVKQEQALERKLAALTLEFETANMGWRDCEKKFAAERKARRALSALLITVTKKL